MSGYTKGEWKATVSVSDGNGWTCPTQWVEITAGEKVIACYATSACEYPDDGENEANARLQAASPDLFEALVNLVACARGEGGTKPNALGLADAAITKAITAEQARNSK